MKSIKLSLLLVAITILVFACKKDKTTSPSPSPPAEPTAADILSSGKWKTTLYIVDPPIDLNGNGNPVSDITNNIRVCDRDDFYTFAKDNTYTFDNGADKCDSTANQTSKGTWTVTADKKKLVLKANGSSDDDSRDLAHFSKDSIVTKNNIRYDGNIYELKRTYTLIK